ncbi:MAG: ATP-binding protein [Micavibrio sp.]|nr:ATP-binding protein [Micavibrio sp.]
MRSLKEKQKAISPGKALLPDDMARLVEALPDAVLATDNTGTILFANQSAEVFFGQSVKMLTGKDIRGFFGAASPARAAFDQLAETGRAALLRDVDVAGRTAESFSAALTGDGVYVFALHYSAVPVKNEWVSRVRQALKPAQHMARVLAHEIKNPLSGIRGAAQLLCKSDLKDDDRELAMLIDVETQRILRLVEKVNIFDDGGQYRHAPVSLHEVLAYVEKIALSGFAKHAEFLHDYDPSLPDVLGQHDHLVQAIVNLVKNAGEALPHSGGRIVLRTRYDNNAGFHPESRVRLPICLEIEDNGPGIAAGIQARMFEPYQTTKAGGDGLGLSIVSKIIDDHGGIVDIVSQPGRTIFRLNFPMPTAPLKTNKGDAA